jgi:hypothetical protein
LLSSDRENMATELPEKVKVKKNIAHKNKMIMGDFVAEVECDFTDKNDNYCYLIRIKGYKGDDGCGSVPVPVSICEATDEPVSKPRIMTKEKYADIHAASSGSSNEEASASEASNEEASDLSAMIDGTDDAAFDDKLEAALSDHSSVCDKTTAASGVDTIAQDAASGSAVDKGVGVPVAMTDCEETKEQYADTSETKDGAEKKRTKNQKKRDQKQARKKRKLSGSSSEGSLSAGTDSRLQPPARLTENPNELTSASASVAPTLASASVPLSPPALPPSASVSSSDSDEPRDDGKCTAYSLLHLGIFPDMETAVTALDAMAAQILAKRRSEVFGDYPEDKVYKKGEEWHLEVIKAVVVAKGFHFKKLDLSKVDLKEELASGSFFLDGVLNNTFIKGRRRFETDDDTSDPAQDEKRWRHAIAVKDGMVYEQPGAFHGKPFTAKYLWIDDENRADLQRGYMRKILRVYRVSRCTSSEPCRGKCLPLARRLMEGRQAFLARFV